MGMTKVTRNFQITLPRDVRELEGIDIGDTLIVTTKGEDIILRKNS
ncbi:MAG: AbrB/MazE/SpoVT family DNA-binding domain-containing protein [Candidatus Aenigmarchaeota archaeon]|nr:AbrB/MazE/SpoVT family DNA-binding domain-containing protein [Candidatus Aenigmarchaeota archaeon]